MKKTISVLFTIMLLLCCIGCSQNKQVEDTTTPPVQDRTDSWNGLTYRIGEDLQDEFRNDSYARYSTDGISVTIRQISNSAADTTPDELISQVIDEATKDGYSCRTGYSNNVEYFYAEKGGEIQIGSYYIQGQNVWMISAIIFNKENVDALDKTVDRLIGYVTSGSVSAGSSTNTENTPPAADPVSCITIHAYVDAQWSAPCCWAWNSKTGEDVFEAWPGQAMTRSGDHYVIQVPATTDYFIINANQGSIQTADVQIETGKDVWIYLDGEGYGRFSQDGPLEIPDEPPVYEDTVTVYAFVPDHWSAPCCWAWSDEADAFSAWPGLLMTAGDGLYTCEIPTWSEYIIINANTGTVQTEDLPITPGKDVWVSIDENGNVVRLTQ